MNLPVLIAVGGNSLIRAGQRGTVAEQMENARLTCECIAELMGNGYQIVLTHGNGPQVGAQLIRSELASSQVYTLPLDSCDASTQGELGYILQNGLRTALTARGLSAPVATLLTQVLVDKDDPAFSHPTKPVGPFYTKEVAEQRKKDLGWQIVEDASRGYRRVVPSPKPMEIVELDIIKQCLAQGMTLIAAGGGGIPVIRENGIYHGVEAVIDKDRASALLARLLGLKTFIISTDTDRVYVNYKKPDQRALPTLTVAEARAYMEEKQFPEGSMKPKIEAAIDFLINGGEQVIITNPEQVVKAVLGDAGTHMRLA